MNRRSPTRKNVSPASGAGRPVGLLSSAAASLNNGRADGSALRQAMGFLLEETGGRRCLIYIGENDAGELRLEAGCNDRGTRIATDDRISRGVAGTVLHTGEPLRLNSDVTPGDTAGPSTEGLVNAVIAVPLRFNGAVSGVLYVDRLASRDRFAAAHLAFACAFTEIIALALRHHPLPRPERGPRTQPRTSASATDPFSPIIGDSRAMQSVIRQARQVAPHHVPVLILGESGTGKELLARSIHNGAGPDAGNFVPLNCTAVPGDLLESELFGHVRGAFTGAGTDRRGLLEEANGGTLFLDEVGDLAPAIQAKLLRVLQEKEFRRVGENRIRRVNFRLITATNRELKSEVARERFRLDLYYRIAVVVLRIPPLRDRTGDLPLLVEHFCRRHAKQSRLRVSAVDQSAMKTLKAHRWPGNVRELENTIHAALVMMNGDAVLGREHLPPAVSSPFAADPGAEALVPSANLPLRQARERFDRSYVISTLERHNGNRTRTASALGISRQALLKMFKRLGLNVPRPPVAPL